MRRLILLFVFCFSALIINAQVIYKDFNSTKLGTSRDIKIQLPRSYTTGYKSYPIIVVLDGDYMFEIVAGNVDYASYWEDIPEAIVIGINQYGSRDEDLAYSEQNGFPVDSGADFFEFISMELIPYIEKNYRTEKFKVAVGHGKTANFINYFLLKEVPLFNAYIAISPDLVPNMETFIASKLSKIESKTFYYTTTSNKDIKVLRQKTEALNTAIKNIDNNNVLSTFNKFNDVTHYSLPAHALPKALESIFFVYQPISKKEYKESILKLETSPVDYLVDKYKTIKDLFGIDKPILVNDFKAIAAAIKKTEKFDYFEALGKLARKEYPDTLLGNYYIGRFYEETGNPKKAMKTYQSAYILKEFGGITKDDVLELADQIKADFGY